jgi:uncharacterized BrkB/YihY/UPF0761 family membrane protein
MTWKEIVDQGKELAAAAGGAWKDYTGGKLTEAQAKALKNTKEQPNWTLIGIVVGGGVLLLFVGALIIRALRK